MLSDEAAFLTVAARLADGIAREAVWSGGRCNWVGAVPSEGSGGHGAPAMAALGPDLYGGTAGVALFLAEAAGALEDARLGATALGAIRLALDHADRIDREVRDGLYAGPVGIAHAAVRVGDRLGAEDVLDGALGVLAAWRRADTPSRSSDTISGLAGAVVGLAALSRRLEEPWLVDTAARLGGELVARARAGPAGLSWAAPGRRSMHDLCGYAHGAAGIGHGFAELYGATREPRFREAAERAFDYERSWLDPRDGTWPDLRGVARRAGRDAPVPSADSWCNGAPGIALSRLRAAELLGSPALGGDAELALAACGRHIAQLISGAPDDFCLCHGAAGVADALLSAGGGGKRLATAVGRLGIDLHLGPGAPAFPCGVPVGETPGLLLGFGGIGLFYLRLSDAQVPSALLVH